jgi:hypothetical protein
MSTAIHPSQRVDLTGVVEVLNEHLTRTLIENTWEDLRGPERERVWTLEQMVAFWTAVILRAPASLGQALREATGGRASGYPLVDTSPQAFFKRSQELSWEFFAGVFRSFVESVAAEEPARFARHHEAVAARFANVLVLDGSNLDPVARRLKVLQGTREAPMPGAIFACYDLMRGTLAELLFTPTLRTGELTLAREAFALLPRNSLILGDRLYGTPRILTELQEKGLYGIFRRQSHSHVEKVREIERGAHGDGHLEDWSIKLGKQAAVPARLIRMHVGKKTYEFVTNVLDPEMLSAREAADLYLDRWQVERVFQDLKEVLNLHCFYCGNTNAIAMQVYAAAIVHTAMRVAQGRIAAQASIEPEALSEAKLFPLLAAASATLITLEVGFYATELANPGHKLTKPDWRTVCCTDIRLRKILADKTRKARKRGKKTPIKKRGSFWQEMPPPGASGRSPQS